MKNILRILLLTMMIGCWSCGSGEEDVPTPTPKPEEKPKIEVTTTAPVLEQTGGTASVTFTSTADWTTDVTEGRAVSWCSVSPTSGSKGLNTLTITTTGNNTYDERYAKVTIKAGATSQSFTITQKQKDRVELTCNKYETSPNDTTFSIKFTANDAWIASSDQEWCKLSTTEGERGTHKIIVSTDSNKENTDRIATITIKAGTATETITVLQYRKESIVVEKEKYEIGFEGGKLVVHVTSNTDYNVKANYSWLTFGKPTEGKIEFEIQKNPNKKVREATIVLNGKYTSTSFTIEQAYEALDDSGVEGMPNEDWNS